VLVLPSNWFPLTRVKWLPLIANSFAVSGIGIAELGVRETTRSATVTPPFSGQHSGTYMGVTS
ncbi:hypothetical protein Tco_0482948, partial [Tanacetum coccineum]